MLSTVMLVDLLSRLFGLARSLINPRVLGAAEYGRLGLLSAYLLFAAFCDLGMTREFEIQLPRLPSHSSVREATIATLYRRFIPKMLTVALAILAAIAFRFGWALSLACAPYVIAFGFAEIFLVQARTDGRYSLINAYTLSSAVLLTVGTVWAAPHFGILGVAWLQSLVLAIGAVILFWRLRLKTHHSSAYYPHPSTPPSPGAEASVPVIETSPVDLQLGAGWLLLGQLLPLLWMTIDRFFLSGRLTAEELGSWTLGSLPGTLLIGLLNTLGAVLIPRWVKKARNFTNAIEVCIFASILGIGMVAYSPFVKRFLPAYASGISWNLSWIIAQTGLSILFFYDAYRRSQIRTVRDSRQWFLRKLIASGAAVVFAIGFEWTVQYAGHEISARWIPVLGFHFFLAAVWTWERTYRLIALQLGLAAISYLLVA